MFTCDNIVLPYYSIILYIKSFKIIMRQLYIEKSGSQTFKNIKPKQYVYIYMCILTFSAFFEMSQNM